MLCEAFPEPQTRTSAPIFSSGDLRSDYISYARTSLNAPDQCKPRVKSLYFSASHMPASFPLPDLGTSCSRCLKCSLLLAPPGLFLNITPSGTHAFPNQQFKAGSHMIFCPARTTSAVTLGGSCTPTSRTPPGTERARAKRQCSEGWRWCLVGEAFCSPTSVPSNL